MDCHPNNFLWNAKVYVTFAFGILWNIYYVISSKQYFFNKWSLWFNVNYIIAKLVIIPILLPKYIEFVYHRFECILKWFLPFFVDVLPLRLHTWLIGQSWFWIWQKSCQDLWDSFLLVIYHLFNSVILLRCISYILLIEFTAA